MVRLTAGTLFDKRTLLFLPASNLRAIAKARASDADVVVLDLEDAVKRADKADARATAVAALDEPWPMPVAIRARLPRHGHATPTSSYSTSKMR